MAKQNRRNYNQTPKTDNKTPKHKHDNKQTIQEQLPRPTTTKD